MKEGMFEYCKLIVKKVSFDLMLFEKEFIKSLTYLSKEERIKFIDWSKREFCQKRQNLMKSVILGERLRNNFNGEYKNVG